MSIRSCALLLVAQGLPRFTKVTRRHKQHPKALTIFFAQVFVVNLVRFADGHEVGVFRALEPRKPLMDEHVVDEEIRQTIQGNARTNPESEVSSQASRDEAVRAGDGENQKEGVVFLEKTGAIRVVILVEVPHRSVHEVFVRQPGHAFHGDEGGQHNKSREKHTHSVQGMRFNKAKKKENTMTNKPESRFVFRSSTSRQSKPKANAATHHVR